MLIQLGYTREDTHGIRAIVRDIELAIDFLLSRLVYGSPLTKCALFFGRSGTAGAVLRGQNTPIISHWDNVSQQWVHRCRYYRMTVISIRSAFLRIQRNADL